MRAIAEALTDVRWQALAVDMAPVQEGMGIGMGMEMGTVQEDKTTRVRSLEYQNVLTCDEPIRMHGWVRLSHGA